LLQWFARQNGVKPGDLTLYDPYYCNGQVVAHLKSLGFPKVINLPIDFYAAQRDNSIPAFDVLVTNPPYSEDHVPRLLDFAAASGKPFLLLMPNYISTMSYYNQPDMLYWVPSQRYRYTSPKILTERLSSKQKRVSPFHSYWYTGLAPDADRKLFKEHCKKTSDDSEIECMLCTISEIPKSARGSLKQEDLQVVFKKQFSLFCKEHSLGKLCAEFTFKGKCECPEGSQFLHEFRREEEPFKRFLAKWKKTKKKKSDQKAKRKGKWPP